MTQKSIAAVHSSRQPWECVRAWCHALLEACALDRGKHRGPCRVPPAPSPPPAPFPSQNPSAITRVSSSSQAAFEGVQTRMRGLVCARGVGGVGRWWKQVHAGRQETPQHRRAVAQALASCLLLGCQPAQPGGQAGWQAACRPPPHPLHRLLTCSTARFRSASMACSIITCRKDKVVQAQVQAARQFNTCRCSWARSGRS